MNRKSKKIAIILILTLLFSLIQPLGIQTAFADSTRYGCSIPNQKTNTVEFIAKADGYDCAYVVGAFSNWQKDDKYKLTWKQDPNDGVWKMMSTISIDNLIINNNLSQQSQTTGAGVEISNSSQYTCEYKFILYKAGQADTWMSDNGTNGSNSSFVWKYFNESLTINTSSNTVSSSRPVDLVAIKNGLNGNREILDSTSVQWSIDPAVTGASIENDVLKISQPIAEGTKIVLNATNGDLVVTKEITVSNDNSNGTFVHFLKKDNNYTNWNFWSFDPGEQVDFQQDTDMGKAAFLTNLQVIARKGNWEAQTQTYNIPTGTKDAYIIENDKNLYTDLESAAKACGPTITSAIMDSKDSITAYLSDTPLSTSNFKLYVDGINVTTGAATTVTVYENNKKVVFDTSGISIDPTSLIEIKADNMFTIPKKVTLRSVLDDYKYDGNDMGATFKDDKINLKLWAPTAHKVEALVYDSYDLTNDNPSRVYQMTLDESNGIHSASIPKAENEDKYYMYRLYFKDRNTNGDIVDKITYAVDPYTYAAGVNGTKGALINLNDETDGSITPTDWSTDTKPALANPEDSILYEMHIRDFTVDPNSGVTQANRGKYLGAVETGTTYTDTTTNTTVSTGIDHLKDLGVTHVHLIPVFDFATVDETLPDGQNKANGEPNRNWGYDPQNFNVPEGSYSSNASDPKVRIKEFRQMVQGFHKNGIRVVMDMVYNHMNSTDNMNNIVPDYYFRSWEDGSLSNSSGCGNEIASERPMVRKFIVDSNSHWVDDYKIDGLRFDLMAILDKTTLNDVKATVQAKNPSIIVYGEPWMAADSPLPSSEQTTKNKGIAGFNDTFRDALRGGNAPGKGFINGGINEDTSGKVQEGIKGSIDGTVDDPDLIINYTEVHDNYNAWDQIEKSQTNVTNGNFRQGIPDNALTDWKVKQDILGIGLVLTSQGIPLFHEGSEMLRTKQGDHNSYKSDDETNDIDWADKAQYKEVFDYYKGIVQLRKEHPAFRLTSKNQIQGSQEVYTLNNGDNEIILQYLKNNANGDKWKNILTIYNGSANSKHVTWLPKSTSGKWNVVADETKVDLANPIKVVNQTENTVDLTVSANSMMVLYDEEGQVGPTADLKWDYLFSDQSTDYMEPMDPKSTDPVKVRFRAKAGEVTNAKVHYYDDGTKQSDVIEMSKIIDTTFYSTKGYDSSKIEFWEGTIPASANTKYYNFEVNNSTAGKTAWISGGVGQNNKGVTATAPKLNAADPNSGIDYGFSIVTDLNTPQWSKEGILYQVMVDRFRDGDTKNNRVAKDPSQFGNPSEVSSWGDPIVSGDESDKVWNNQFFGGDLTGVKEAIPYLKDTLGVTGLYLMPIFESQSDHKYDADTYDYVDKNFGGNKGLSDLSSSLKSNGMNLMLDGVFNHTSIEGPLFKNKRDYYFTGEFKDKDNVPLNYYPWHGYANLAKLNYGNQDVKNYIYNGENSVAKRYLKAPYNIDGWRLDAAEDLNTQPRDYKINEVTDPTQQANNLKIWQEFNQSVKSTNPNAFILGEYWGNDNQWYYGKAWDGKMNYGGFLMPFIENRSTGQWLGNQSIDNRGNMSVADIGMFSRNYFKGFPYQTILNSTNSISTHDKPRFLNWDYTGAGNTSMVELSAALQLTYPGIPMIYYGEEIGTVGKGNGKDPYNRGTFDWNVENWNKEMLNDNRKLIATRKENKDAFVYGAFEEVASNRSDKYIVYSRYGNNNKSLVVLNNSGANSTKSITIDKLERYGFKDNDVIKDVMTGNTAIVSGGKVVLTSKDMSAAVYVLSDKAPNISDVTNSTDLNLTDETDSRIKVSNVENAKITSYTNGVSLAWDDYKDKDKASNIVLRAFENNKVVKEVKVATTDKIATLPDISSQDILSGKYTVSIKVEANRDLMDSTVNDIYMDSDYLSPGVDTTAPKMVTITPNDNTVDVEKTANVVINFDENIVLADKSKISVVDSTGKAVEFEATVSGKQLTVNPNQDLTEGNSYTVTVGKEAVKDEANNALEVEITVNFKTEEPKDTTAPKMVTTTPNNNAVDVEKIANVVFDFDENIVLADKTKISVVDSTGKAVEFEAIVSGKELTVNPKEDLTEGNSYTVTVEKEAVKDEANNALETEITVNFKTQEPKDITAPKMVTTTPNNNAVDVEKIANVVIDFDENIVLADKSKISVVDSTGKVVAFAATALGKELTVNPNEDLKEGTSYTVTVGVGAITDESNNALDSEITVNFKTQEPKDTTAPKMVTIIPNDNAVDVDKTSNVVIDFDENIVLADKSKISVVDSTGKAVEFEAIVSGKELTVNPKEDLTEGNSYTVTVEKEAVKDEANNALETEITVNFKTQEPKDITAPKMVTTTPNNNAVDVEKIANVVIDFDENIVLADKSKISVVDSTGKAIEFEATVSGKQLTVNPKEDLTEGTSYTVTVGKEAVKDESNNALDSEITVNFKTEEPKDTTAPKMVTTTPNNNAVDVEKIANVVFDFDENIVLADKSKISVVDSTGKAVEFEAIVSGKQLTVNPNQDLTEGNSYTVTVGKEAVKDEANNALDSEITVNFKTEEPKDTTAPKMVTTTPNNNAVDVEKIANVVFDFDENIVLADKSKISVVDSTGKAVEFEAIVSGKQLTVNPNQDLAEGNSYTVTVEKEAVKDEANNALETEITVNFKTQEPKDTTAPKMVTTTPNNNAVDVEKTANVVFDFDENIVLADKSKISVVDSTGKAVEFEAIVSGKELTVNPKEDLTEGNSYTVTVEKEAVKDEANNALDSEITVNFKTQEPKDTTAPKMVSVTPNNNAVDVEKTANVVINFDENIVLADKSKISVVDSTGKSVEFEATVSGKELTVNPNQDLTEGNSYTVTVGKEAVKDEANNALETQITVNFKTQEPKDTTAPKMVTVTPKDNAAEVDKTSNVVIDFDENIVLADKSKISVVDSTGKAVEFEAIVSGKELTVNPKEDLTEGTSYTVTVEKEAVKDEANNILKNSLSVKFTTKQAYKPNNETSKSSSSSSNSSSKQISASTVDKAIGESSSEDVKIDMTTKDSVIEKGVFEVLAENPTKNLVLTEDNYSWTFTGTDITKTTDVPNDIDTTISTISPNVEEINKVTFDKPVVNVYFSYHGELPGKAKIEMKIDSKYNGKTMFMYHYNSVTKKLELTSSNVQIQNGQATFEINHCSDYILSETEIPGAVKQGWNKNADGTWSFLKTDFTNFSGWLSDNGTWYFMQPSGVMKIGWLNDNGIWYFMQPSGAMKTGWINSNDSWYYLNQSGDMQIGWKQVDGKWYYLYSNGEMAKNITVDGWNLSSNGEGTKIA